MSRTAPPVDETAIEEFRQAVRGDALREGEERERAAHGENYERLVELENERDPENLFRANQNVAPTVRGRVRRPYPTPL